MNKNCLGRYNENALWIIQYHNITYSDIRWVLLNIGLQVNILRHLDNILLIDTEYTLS